MRDVSSKLKQYLHDRMLEINTIIESYQEMIRVNPEDTQKYTDTIELYQVVLEEIQKVFNICEQRGRF